MKTRFFYGRKRFKLIFETYKYSESQSFFRKEIEFLAKK